MGVYIHPIIDLVDATTAGTQVDHAGVTKFRVNPADTLHLEHKTQAVDSSTADGEGVYVIWYKEI